MTVKPIPPRNWEITNAIVAAKKPPLMLPRGGGKAIPALNGSQKNRRNKRPITLPERA